jgi:hypothetical protein
MSTVVKNPSPKSRFQETANHVERHRNLIASPEFERAADYAMLQYSSRLALNMNNPTFNDYATMGVKITGAKEFLQEMRLLAESATSKQVVPQDNLEHAV